MNEIETKNNHMPKIQIANKVCWINTGKKNCKHGLRICWTSKSSNRRWAYKLKFSRCESYTQRRIQITTIRITTNPRIYNNEEMRDAGAKDKQNEWKKKKHQGNDDEYNTKPSYARGNVARNRLEGMLKTEHRFD